MEGDTTDVEVAGRLREGGAAVDPFHDGAGEAKADDEAGDGVKGNGDGVAEGDERVRGVVDVDVDVDPAFDQAEGDAAEGAKEGDEEAVSERLRQPDLAEIDADGLEDLLNDGSADKNEQQITAGTDFGDDGAEDAEEAASDGQQGDGDVGGGRCLLLRWQMGDCIEVQDQPRGSSRPRVAMMLRWISLVPAATVRPEVER
jgi:hypothetical protein